MFFLITFKILDCWRVSREMLSGRSSESTTPLTKFKYSGMISSQLSMMKTRLKRFISHQSESGQFLTARWIFTRNIPDVELDGVLLFFVFKEIEWGSLWDEKKGSELELTFNREMLDSQMIFPVIGQGFVEFGIFLIGNVIWVTSPDWFGLKISVFLSQQ